ELPAAELLREAGVGRRHPGIVDLQREPGAGARRRAGAAAEDDLVEPGERDARERRQRLLALEHGVKVRRPVLGMGLRALRRRAAERPPLHPPCVQRRPAREPHGSATATRAGVADYSQATVITGLLRGAWLAVAGGMGFFDSLTSGASSLFHGAVSGASSLA